MNRRKPKLTPARRKRIQAALAIAAERQTEYWDALRELEVVVGFNFSLDNNDLAGYGADEKDVEFFADEAWEKRDK